MFTVTDFELIYNVIQTYFGEENTDLIDTHLERDKKTYYQNISEITENTSITTAIVVYFPEITIKNELKQTHTITDVYAALTRNGDFYVGRTSFTTQEAMQGYSHSHTYANRNYTRMFRPFCLGTGCWANLIHYLGTVAFGEIVVTKEELENTALQFCYLLPQVLATESLAGGPYFRLNNVSDFKALSHLQLPYALPLSAASSFMQKYKIYNVKHINQKLYNYTLKQLLNRIVCIWLKALPLSQYLNELSVHTSLIQTILKLSAITLEEINKGTFDDLYSDRDWLISYLLEPTIMVNEHLYSKKDVDPIREFEASYEKPLFTFKGQDKYIIIKESATNTPLQTLYCVSPFIWNNFLSAVFINTIKYQYAE